MAKQLVEWTAEQLRVLRDGAAAGLTTQQISDVIGGDCTRFAVLGKGKRLGVKFLYKPEHGRKTAPAAPPRPKPKPRPRPPAGAGGNLLQAVEDIAERASACRWPFGDPQQPGFHFCGELQVPGKPYCPEHHKIAHQPGHARPVPDYSRERLRPGQTSLWR